MATTTRLVLEQRVSEALGDYYPLTTSSAGNAGGTTLISTTFQDLPGGNDNDAFENWYAHITSGTDTGNVRRASTYVQSTNTLTVSRAYSAQIATSVTLVLHRHDPSDYWRCISRALEELYPHLYLPIRDETLVVDDLLSNSDFETFAAGVHTGWAVGGAGASVAQSATILRHGADAAAITAGAGAAAQYTQSVTVNTNQMTGKAVHFKMWVYATAASTARVRINYDGTTYFSSAYHTGADQWELLEATGTLPTAATQVQAVCEVAASGVGRFDAGWLSIAPVYRYTLPTALLRLHRIEQQDDELHPDRLYIPAAAFQRGLRLRLVGKGLLARPATDTATTEIGEPEVNVVVEYATMLMCELLAGRAAQTQRDRYLRDVVYWREKAEQHLQRFKTGGLAAQGGTDWYVESDSTSRYLVLPQER